MIAQDISDDEVVARAREILSRPEYRHEPSLLERFINWLLRRLSLPEPSTQVVDPPGPASALVQLLVWIVLVVIVIALVVLIVKLVMARTKRIDVEDTPIDVTIEHRKTTKEWSGDAERFEAEGNYKEALRCRFGELVRELIDQRRIDSVPGRTTGELREDIASNFPGAFEPFDHLCFAFELAWFADVAVSSQDYERVKELVERVRNSPVDREASVSMLVSPS